MSKRLSSLMLGSICVCHLKKALKIAIHVDAVHATHSLFIFFRQSLYLLSQTIIQTILYGCLYLECSNWDEYIYMYIWKILCMNVFNAHRLGTSPTRRWRNALLMWETWWPDGMTKSMCCMRMCVCVHSLPPIFRQYFGNIWGMRIPLPSVDLDGEPYK